MKKRFAYILIFLFSILMLLPFFGKAQGGTWPVRYNDSDPSGAPSAAGTRLYFNTATNTLFTWEPAPSSTWRKQPKAFDQISGCAAPAYTPTARQSTFAVNSCTPPELYQYTGAAWECLNCVDGLNLTAGAGITLSGTAPDITISNTAPDQTVTMTDGTGIDVTGTYPNFTVTNTSPNVVQTLSIAGQDLSISDGNTITLPATGITSLNSQTGSTQTFATGTTGTDFGISSAANTHTFNLPTASASNRGALSATDWSTFNSKVGGGGTAGYLPKFSTSSVIANSIVYDNGTNVGIGTTSPSALPGFSPGRSLHIYDATSNLPSIYLQNTANGFGVGLDNSRAYFLGSRAVNYYWNNITGAGSAMRFYNKTTGTEVIAAEFDATNNFRVGTNGSGTGRLSVYGSGNTSSSWSMQIHNSTGSNNALMVRDDGNVSIGASSPPAKLSVSATNGYGQLNLATAYTPTSSADALGSTGDVAWDANYIYIKTAAGWKRAALSTF